MEKEEIIKNIRKENRTLLLENEKLKNENDNLRKDLDEIKKCLEIIYKTYQSNATCKKALCKNITLVYGHTELESKQMGLRLFIHIHMLMHGNKKKWKIGQRHSQYCINLLIRHHLKFRIHVD